MSGILSSPSLYMLFLIAGIHGYFGTHVIQRRVIFVDLAIAQIAAFGAVFATLLGYSIDQHGTVISIYSAVFAAAGGLMFSITRPRTSKVPHEAIIGIIYGVASSATLLAISRSQVGVTDLHALLAGRIEFVTWNDVIQGLIAYSAVAIFHVVFRRRFIELSSGETITNRPSWYVKLWDSIFYITFAVIVSKSVPTVGVLLVFSFLVIPAVVASLFTEDFGRKLLVGIGIGMTCSILGSLATEVLDLPRGPTVSCVLGLLLLVAGICIYVYRSEKPLKAAAAIVLYAALIGGAGLVLYAFRYSPGDYELALDGIRSNEPGRIKTSLNILKNLPRDETKGIATTLKPLLKFNDVEVRRMAIEMIVDRELSELYGEIIGLLGDKSDTVREAVIGAMGKIDARQYADDIARFARAEEDNDLKLKLAQTLINLGRIDGIMILLDIMETSEAEETRHEAFIHLKEHVAADFAFDHVLEPPKNSEQIKAIRNYIVSHEGSIRWDAAMHKFVFPRK